MISLILLFSHHNSIWEKKNSYSASFFSEICQVPCYTQIIEVVRQSSTTTKYEYVDKFKLLFGKVPTKSRNDSKMNQKIKNLYYLPSLPLFCTFVQFLKVSESHNIHRNPRRNGDEAYDIERVFYKRSTVFVQKFKIPRHP